MNIDKQSISVCCLCFLPEVACATPLFSFSNVSRVWASVCWDAFARRYLLFFPCHSLLVVNVSTQKKSNLSNKYYSRSREIFLFSWNICLCIDKMWKDEWKFNKIKNESASTWSLIFFSSFFIFRLIEVDWDCLSCACNLGLKCRQSLWKMF